MMLKLDAKLLKAGWRQGCSCLLPTLALLQVVVISLTGVTL